MLRRISSPATPGLTRSLSMALSSSDLSATLEAMAIEGENEAGGKEERAAEASSSDAGESRESTASPQLEHVNLGEVCRCVCS